MILENPDKYLTESEFFTHMKFYEYILGLKKLGFRKVFYISDIALVDEKIGSGHMIFRTALFYELKVYLRTTFEKNLKEVIERLSDDPMSEEESTDKKLFEKMLHSLKNEEPIAIKDIEDAWWHCTDILKGVQFKVSDPIVSNEKKKIARQNTDNYLDDFINDRLLVRRRNYYRFEEQKRALIKIIEEGKKIKLYGRNFILRERINYRGELVRSSDFAFIQTLYALQKMEYLIIHDMWVDKEYASSDPMDRSFNYYVCVNIILKDVFVFEINEQFQDDNPDIYFESYDENNKVLKFAGKEIPLALKRKETDSIRTLETLLKEKERTWWNDEILEDWGNMSSEKHAKNKVYAAVRKLNNLIKKSTGIDDFIEGTTTSFHINERYLKVDE